MQRAVPCGEPLEPYAATLAEPTEGWGGPATSGTGGAGRDRGETSGARAPPPRISSSVRRASRTEDGTRFVHVRRGATACAAGRAPGEP